MLALKIVLGIVGVLLLLVVLVVGGGIWMIHSAERDRAASIEKLKTEFSVGRDVRGLVERAKALKAGGYVLYADKEDAPIADSAFPPPPAPLSDASSAGRESAATVSIIAQADSMFDGLSGPKKFPEKLEMLKVAFSKMTDGLIVIDFPVFMNARWVFNAKFAGGKVTEVRTVYLD